MALHVHFRQQEGLDCYVGHRLIKDNGITLLEIEVQAQVGRHTPCDGQVVTPFKLDRQTHPVYYIAVTVPDIIGTDSYRLASGIFHQYFRIAVIQYHGAPDIDPGWNGGDGQKLGHVSVLGKIDPRLKRQGLHHRAVGLGQS